jgi:hypothetical protein
MATTDDLLDSLMEKCKKHDDPTGEGGFLEQLFRTTLYQKNRSETSEHIGNPAKEESR